MEGSGQDSFHSPAKWLELCFVSLQVARETGVLLDPVYSLAAWEMAVQQAQAEGAKAAGMGSRVCMLHCGGMHGLYGLAQRYPAEF